ncbi:daz-1 [Pristionchus pacificus]|nr:daz-1 [Pristionchus pacificus]|eukprot:PDM63122.1 daz-1 [Pristionchus pacificus]
MGSQYAYGEGAQQRNGQVTPQMSYYTAPRLFNTVAEHIKSGQAVEHIPYRLFVGGFGAQVTETALREHFEQFFTIRDVKVIRSPEGISKGYGFVTFDTEDEAKAVQAMNPEELKLNGKQINLGPALRKMVHSRYSNEYPMAMANNGQQQQYPMQSPSMQYAYTYPTPPQAGTQYMMSYAPQGMVPVSHSMPLSDESSQTIDTSGGEEPQPQQLQQPPPALSLHPGVQNCQQPYYYVPPPTPMTPTFRAFPCAPLYGAPQTPQMYVDGTTLYPQSSMDAVQSKPAETAMGDIRLSYATIAAKLKSPETTSTTVVKEVDQVSTQLGSMKMNGAGGDYAATAKNAVVPPRA